MKRKFKYSYLFLIPLILYETMPFVITRIPFVAAVFFVGVWLLLESQIIRISLFRNAAILRKYVVYAIFYLIYTFMPYVYVFLGYGKTYGSLYNLFLVVILTLLSVAVPMIAIVCGRINELKVLSVIGLFGLCFTGIKSLLAGADIIAIGAARADLEYGQGVNDEKIIDVVREIYSAGLGNYDYMYACAFFIPILLYSVFKVQNIILKCVFLFTAIMCAASIRAGGLGTPIVVAAVGCVLFAIALFKSVKCVKVFGLVALIMLVLFTYNPRIFSFLAPPFRGLADVLEANSSFAVRCASIADSLEALGGNQYAYERYGRQRMSLSTFCSSGTSVLFGIGDYKDVNTLRWGIGGHSTICDLLARQGLFGLIWFVLYYWSYCRVFRRLSISFFCTASYMIMPMLMGMVMFASYANPIPRIGEFIFILVPALQLYYQDSKINYVNDWQRRFMYKWI